ncbi:uncharacterized protein LOC133639429 [Entelurus aequoreus]|uniref:uncharacterized protein LOC133639429 n=1 Tax=Entelurus aequoreus TaxID=161455 RepID=UPI002B1E3781|nr:uncharacterized protein LOC133639429 [Entelurus aequoreus]
MSLGAKASLTSGYHPEANGQTERLNQQLETGLRCVVCQNPSTWSKHLVWVDETSSGELLIQAAPAQDVRGQLVSQGDAAEELAHQVSPSTAAAHRRPQAASGDPDEEEEDEAHQSSQGHDLQQDATLLLSLLPAMTFLSPPPARPGHAPHRQSTCHAKEVSLRAIERRPPCWRGASRGVSSVPSADRAVAMVTGHLITRVCSKRVT